MKILLLLLDILGFAGYYIMLNWIIKSDLSTVQTIIVGAILVTSSISNLGSLSKIYKG